jgi:hypothetical protein
VPVVTHCGPADREVPGGNAATWPVRTSPYKGLVPYSAQDAHYFFGREDDCEIIEANLVAARLTVLYGASGVGKSSLLHAGLSRDLRELAEGNLAELGAPEFVPVVFSTWHDDDVVEAVRRAVHEAVTELVGSAPAPAGSFADDLAACGEAVGGEVLLILDQFEEYFLYHPRDEGDGGFDAQLARAITRQDLRANFLIAIREDALAGLDRFKGRIPHLFDNYLRVRHLGRDAAKAAIERPIARFNADRGGDEHDAVEIEPALVERVLDEVTAGQAILEGEGRGGVEVKDGERPEDDQIETPYLQLVMTRLWEEELRQESHVLRLATLERLGGSVRIVRSHLDESLAALTLAEHDLAAKIFHHLVTPSGTKVAHAPSDLANYADVDEDQLIGLLEHLSHGSVRVLRPVAGAAGAVHYEIFHDVLAAPILDWRRRYVADAQRVQADEQRREAERRVHVERRRARTFRAFAIASAVFAAGALVAATLAVRSGREARSQKLAALATSLLEVDPAESVRRASEALDVRQTPAAEDALRAAIEESRVRAVLAGHRDWITSATYSPDGERILTASNDGTARLWSASSGDQVGTLRGHRGEVTAALFGDAGRRVVTAGLDGTAQVWDARTHRRLRALRPNAGPLYGSMVAFSDDGRYVVTAGRGGQGRHLGPPDQAAARPGRPSRDGHGRGHQP